MRGYVEGDFRVKCDGEIVGGFIKKKQKKKQYGGKVMYAKRHKTGALINYSLY